MKRILSFIILFSTSIAISAPLTLQWGKTGHRATAEIASKYLTPQAKKAVNEILDGESMALVANYGDDIKSDKSMDKYKVWHYLNIPEGKTYEEVKDQLPKENLLNAIEECKKGLKDNATSHEQKQFYLKMLIHIIGDLHQPLHLGHLNDRGGNSIIVFWFGDVTNLHSVWDDKMLESYQMSYSEIANTQKQLTEAQIKDIQKGSVVDWLKEIHLLTNKVYASAENGDRLQYKYMYDWMSVVRNQINKGGIRLAKILNDIFE